MNQRNDYEAVPMDMTDEETGEIKHGIWIPDDSESVTHVRYFYKHSKDIFVNLLFNSTDRKMKVLGYLIDVKSPSENKVAVTHRKLSQELGLPESTINNAMKFLQDHDYIRMVQNGLWMVNPDLDMKGYESKYLRLHREYCDYQRRPRREKGVTKND